MAASCRLSPASATWETLSVPFSSERTVPVTSLAFPIQRICCLRREARPLVGRSCGLPRGARIRLRGARLQAQNSEPNRSGEITSHSSPDSPSASSSSPSPSVPLPHSASSSAPPAPSSSRSPPTPPPPPPPSSPPPSPSFQDGVTWFCLSLIGLIALIDLSPLGPLLRAAPPQSAPALLALAQWLFFVLPSLSWCRDRRFPLRATLKLQLPRVGEAGEGQGGGRGEWESGGRTKEGGGNGGGEGEALTGGGNWWKPIAAGAVGGPILWALLFSVVSLKAGAGGWGEGAGGVAELAAASAGAGDSVSATALLLGPVLLPDGAGGSLTATATAVSSLPLLDLLQLFLWVGVSPAVAEELLFRGLLLTALQEKLGRIDAAMLSAALFALFHLSLSLFFPNMALGIAAGLLTVYSNSVLPAVALHATYNASALVFALTASAVSASV